MYSMVSTDDDNSLMPGFVISIALNFIASSIGEERACNLLDSNSEEIVTKLEVPLVYMAARSDSICTLAKARSMFNDYKGTTRF